MRGRCHTRWCSRRWRLTAGIGAVQQRAKGQGGEPGATRGPLHERTFSGLASVPAVEQPRDVYTWVVRALLHPPPPGAGGAAAEGGPQGAAGEEAAATLQYVLLLIGRKWERMDVAAALDCLPAGTKFSDMGACVSVLSMGIMRRSNGRTLHVRLPPARCLLPAPEAPPMQALVPLPAGRAPVMARR